MQNVRALGILAGKPLSEWRSASGWCSWGVLLPWECVVEWLLRVQIRRVVGSEILGKGRSAWQPRCGWGIDDWWNPLHRLPTIYDPIGEPPQQKRYPRKTRSHSEGDGEVNSGVCDTRWGWSTLERGEDCSSWEGMLVIVEGSWAVIEMTWSFSYTPRVLP